MKRKTLTLIITYTSALVVVLSGFVIKYANESLRYRSAERYAQLHAVSQLSDSLAQMSNTLVKGMYAGSPELQAAVSAEIWNHSAAAIASIASLPLSDVSLEQTETFISRAGDYAYYISRRAASHTDLSEEERETLASLSETADSLSQHILTLENDIYAGNINFTSDKAGTLASAVQSFSDMEETFPDYTSVDYDGMMSAHMSMRTPLLTAGTNEIDLDEAMEIAANAFHTDVANVVLTGESAGTIPSYNFSAGDGAYATICKNGGYVLSTRNVNAAQEGNVSIEKALEIAKDYLASVGYDGMQQVYYHNDGGVATFRFAYDDDGVIIYPDMVTVGVALTDGSVASLNATDYVMNHHDRELAAPEISQHEAEKTISSDLNAKCSGRAVIHSPGMREVQCYEFLCKTEDGRKMLIYCDTETGSQCKLTLIHESDDGVVLT